MPGYEASIDTQEDLLHAIEHRAFHFIVNRRKFREYLNAPTENDFDFRIGRHLRLTRAFPVEHYIQNLERIARLYPKFAQEVTQLYAQSLMDNFGFPRLYMSQESLSFITMGFTLPKRSPLLGPFNGAIARFREMGITNHLRRNSLRRKVKGKLKSTIINTFLKKHQTMDQFNRETAHGLHLSEIKSSFLFWIIGSSLAAIWLLYEIVMNKIHILFNI